MTPLRWGILAAWVVLLAGFFIQARPAPSRPISYRADPSLAPWVGAVVAEEGRTGRLQANPAAPGAEPDLVIGRQANGTPVAGTRLVVAGWAGGHLELVESSERLASWRTAARSGRVRFAVPGPNSPLGREFVAQLRALDPAAEADFYRAGEPMRDRDDLYLEDFRNFGPARWDAGILYEDAALQINQSRDDQGVRPLLQIVYLTDLPQIRYLASGGTAAEPLIAALTAPAGQSLALNYGVRPIDLRATSPASLFERFRNLGAKME